MPEVPITESKTTSKPNRAQARIANYLSMFSKLQVALVIGLIFLGGNVKSHEAGLSVPDWPTSYGYNMFTFPYEHWIGGIWYEHVHRLVASGVGAITVLLALGVWIVRREYRVLGIAMVVAVVLQGVLGGLTVLLKLPAWTSSAHGILAQIFLCMSVAMAFLLHARDELSANVLGDTHTQRAAVSLIGALFVQLALGAFVRHTEAGLAVLDFPTVAGSYIPYFNQAMIETLNIERAAAHLPPVEWLQVILHLLHRYWALVVFAAVCEVWLISRRSADVVLRSYGRSLMILVFIQITLGISIVLTQRAILPTSLHVVTGAMLMGLTMLTIMRAFFAKEIHT